LVSRRAHFLSDILAHASIRDIMKYLPIAYKDGTNMEARERMLNASTISGMAFTNVSLGIVHSMAHTLGSIFSLPHGLSNAILLPYVMKFNEGDETAKSRYAEMAAEIGEPCLVSAVLKLRAETGIPNKLSDVLHDRAAFTDKLSEMAEMALADGCTKTNPIIPTVAEIAKIYMEAYE
ncbi:MAG: iron-containing alcohol dehydrogenase, partial [Clostridia bacterium]